MKTGYKQTEVGVIPEEWDSSHLGEVFEFKNGLNKAKEFFGHGTPIVNYMDVFEKCGLLSCDLQGRVSLSKEEVKRFDVRKGDVFFTRTSETAAEVGMTSVMLDAPEDTVFSGFILRARPKNDSLDNQFKKYCFSTRAVRRQIISQSTETTRALTNGRYLSAIAIARPPLPEQRAIAEALSDVDALLGALDQLIAKKRDLKQATMQQLLTGQTRLPGFHGEWEIKKLGEVATFYKGKGLPKSALDPYGAEPCIHYGELFTRYPETIREIISRTDNADGTFRSVANDVLMPTSDVTPRGLAKASCVNIDGVILGGDILVIRSDTKLILGTFLSYVIRFEENQVLQLVTGSTVFHLYGTDMKKFTFSMPTLPEQTAIAEVLSEMDTEIAALEQRLAKTRDLKQGMMQELLTGKTRLV